jgi:hypothetical protein
MGVLDTIRAAAGPVVGSAKGVERQTDDDPGGGIVDETDVVSPSLLVSSATFGLVSQDAARDAGFEDTADVDDIGSGVRAGVGAGDQAFEEFADGVEGTGTSAPALVGRALRFVSQNPLLVGVAIVGLYLAPLLASSLDVAANLTE